MARGCPEKCRHRCIKLLARTASERLPELIRNDSRLDQILTDQDFAQILRFGHLPQEAAREVMLLWADRGTEMLAHSGRLFLKKGNDAGFHRWGQELLELACQCAVDRDRTKSAAPATYFELDANGCIHTCGPIPGKAKHTIVSLGPDSWGVDEGVQPGHIEDPNTQLADWRAGVDQLRKWEGFPLRDFSDTYAIQRWANLHPTEFSSYCDRFFPAVLSSPEIATRQGFFPHYLLAVLVQMNPKFAYEYWASLREVSNNCVYAVTDVEIVPAALWKSNFNDLGEIQRLRSSTLVNADNDEELMGLALNATQEDSVDQLVDICREFLTSDLSKIRALAVSVLAWSWHDSVAPILERLRHGDPSSWVRQHAKWALDIQRQDSACRRAYRRALAETDEHSASNILHVMRPALLPSCAAWREIEETQTRFPDHNCSPRKEALIRHFWFRWDCVSNHRHDTTALGRRMKEYLRGHKITSQVEQQMSPWWVP